MKVTIKKTRKFSFIKANKVYYTIYKGKLCQIRVIKAEYITLDGDSGWNEFEYEIAGFGSFKANTIPYLYNTAEDAIKGCGRINTRCGIDVIFYCEEHHLISYHYISGFMGGHYYIETYRWNGYKVVERHGGGADGIEVRVNMLNGDITINCEDDIYTNKDECIKANKIECLTF